MWTSAFALLPVFSVPSRAGAAHIVQVGPVGALPAKESAPPSKQFGKATPRVRDCLWRACFWTVPDRPGCAAHHRRTAACWYDVSLHGNLLLAVEVVAPDNDVGRDTREDAYEGRVRKDGLNCMQYAIPCMNGTRPSEPSADHCLRRSAPVLCGCRSGARHEPFSGQSCGAHGRGSARDSVVCADDAERFIDGSRGTISRRH